jgi:hypothetical protein
VLGYLKNGGQKFKTELVGARWVDEKGNNNIAAKSPQVINTVITG